MQKSLLKLYGLVIGMSLSATVSALGMGGINVTSGLGQVLKADIDLVAVSRAEKSSLVARLASPEIYKSAGLEYPYGNKIKFAIENRANGETYLKVTSAQPVNDPFVVMLVEMTWSSGKLLREYTFLLDPPGYVVALPEQAQVKPVAPALQSPVAEVPVVPDESVLNQAVIGTVVQEPSVSAIEIAPEVETAVPAEVAAPVEAVPETAVAEVTAEQEAMPENKPVFAIEQGTPETETETAGVAEVAANDEWLVVRKGDTLGKLAKQNKLTDVSLERMLVAMYRVNAEVFDAKNMNRIRAGKILRMPTQVEIDEVGQTDAVKEIRAQVADWNAYRQQLAGAASLRSEKLAADQVATGKIASSVSDKAPIAKETAKEVLKLSKGEVPGDQASAGSSGKPVVSEQDKRNAAREDAIAKDKADKEALARTAMLEQNKGDIEKLAQLKTEVAALAKQPESEKGIEAASQVKPAPVAKPKPPVKVEEPSLVDQVMGWVDQIISEPLYLGGGAAVLFGLLGLGWMVKKRKDSPSMSKGKKSDDAGSKSLRMAAPAMSSPENGDFTAMFPTQAEANEQLDEADPISEADLFLNFGRDAQAEEILKEALQSTPDNHKIHLKLLEIYSKRNDPNAFSTVARQLMDSGDEDAAIAARAMGRELDPNNPLYGGTGDGSVTGKLHAFNSSDATQKIMPTEPSKPPSVDFDLGDSVTDSEPSAVDDFLNDMIGATAVSDSDDDRVTPENDFFSGASRSGSTAEETAKPPLTVDFDIGSDFPEEADSSDDTDLSLNESTLDAVRNKFSLPATNEDAVKQPSDDSLMEFTLDFPEESKIEKPFVPRQAVDSGLAGISLNLDAVDAGTSNQPSDEQRQEAATKLDLAKAYQEMGDVSGAREILEEVLREGDDEQRDMAQSLLGQLG